MAETGTFSRSMPTANATPLKRNALDRIRQLDAEHVARQP